MKVILLQPRARSEIISFVTKEINYLLCSFTCKAKIDSKNDQYDQRTKEHECLVMLTTRPAGMFSPSKINLKIIPAIAKCIANNWAGGGRCQAGPRCLQLLHLFSLCSSQVMSLMHYLSTILVQISAANDSSVFTITEQAPTKAFSWLKAPTCTFTLKTLCNCHKGRVATRHCANQPVPCDLCVCVPISHLFTVG